MKQQNIYVDNSRNTDGSIDVTMNFPDLESYLEMLKLFPILANGDFTQHLASLQQPDDNGNWELTDDDRVAVRICKTLAAIYDRLLDIISDGPENFSKGIVRKLDRDSRDDVKWLKDYADNNPRKADIISDYFCNTAEVKTTVDAIDEFEKLLALLTMFYKLIDDELDGHWHTHIMRMIGDAFMSSISDDDCSEKDIIDALVMMVSVATNALVENKFDHRAWWPCEDPDGDQGIHFYYNMIYHFANFQSVTAKVMSYTITENDRFAWMLLNGRCQELVDPATGEIKLIDLISTFEALMRG